MKTFSARAEDQKRKWYLINADKVVLTGKKETEKVHRTFSGFVGGHHSETPRMIRARRPEQLILLAVRGMIPHNKLGRKIFTKLRVYRGEKHEHEAQSPIEHQF